MQLPVDCSRSRASARADLSSVINIVARVLERKGRGGVVQSAACSLVLEASYEDESQRIVHPRLSDALSINRPADCNRDTICLLPVHCRTWKERGEYGVINGTPPTSRRSPSKGSFRLIENCYVLHAVESCQFHPKATCPFIREGFCRLFETSRYRQTNALLWDKKISIEN